MFFFLKKIVTQQELAMNKMGQGRSTWQHYKISLFLHWLSVFLICEISMHIPYFMKTKMHFIHGHIHPLSPFPNGPLRCQINHLAPYLGFLPTDTTKQDFSISFWIINIPQAHEQLSVWDSWWFPSSRTGITFGLIIVAPLCVYAL